MQRDLRGDGEADPVAADLGARPELVLSGVAARVSAGREWLGIGYAEGSPELGEYAVEYLRRVSFLLRVFLAVEGSEDEVELITETQWFLRPNIFLRLNNAFGLTSKATGWVPEVRLVFSFS